MIKKQFFIVWNQSRTEGFITDDKPDAMFVSEGISLRTGNPLVGEAFRECYCEDEADGLLMQEVELEV